MVVREGIFMINMSTRIAHSLLVCTLISNHRKDTRMFKTPKEIKFWTFCCRRHFYGPQENRTWKIAADLFLTKTFIAFYVYFNWSFSAENHVRELKQKWWYVLLKPHSSAVGLQGYPTVGISITISLSKNVFKEHTSTQSGLFEFLFSGFAQMFRQVVPVRIQSW